MGYTIGMPSLKLSNIDGKGGKHCGNFHKVAKEALKERQGLDMDINPALAKQNIYIGQHRIYPIFRQGDMKKTSARSKGT